VVSAQNQPLTTTNWIGTIFYIYKSDIDQAERWFEKAVKEEALLAPAAYYYGQLLMLERDEWEKNKKYFKQSAEEGFELAYAEYASILYLDKIDVAEAEVYFKKAEEANCLPAPHAHNYGELLIKEKNEIEKGNRYLDLAEADGYYEEWRENAQDSEVHRQCYIFDKECEIRSVFACENATPAGWVVTHRSGWMTLHDGLPSILRNCEEIYLNWYEKRLWYRDGWYANSEGYSRTLSVFLLQLWL